MGDVLPRETENTVYRYLIALSKLRLGILTEQGEGSYELVPLLVIFLDLASVLQAASSAVLSSFGLAFESCAPDNAVDPRTGSPSRATSRTLADAVSHLSTQVNSKAVTASQRRALQWPAPTPKTAPRRWKNH